METTKTYVLPDNQNDLATMMAMNGGMNGMWNNPFIYLVWMMFAGRFFGNNGWGDGQTPQNVGTQAQLSAIREQMSTNQNTSLLMDAIKGNSAALGQLSTSLGCDFNTLKESICDVRNAVATVGGQVGFSSERVINAVEKGDCSITQAIKDCCCNTQKAILEMGYQNQLSTCNQTNTIQNSINHVVDTVDKGFQTLSFQNQTQTCNLQNTVKDATTLSTNQILAKLDAMQNQALLDKIDSLREKNNEQAVIINNAQQTATFGQMINAATAPITAAVNVLQNDINSVKCRLPETVTLPANNSIAVPVSGVQLGAFSWPYYNGYSGCGCNNSLWG